MTYLLEAVRGAERTKTNAYDSELQIYINAAIYDLKRLHIVFDESHPEDEIVSAVICYVKANFGTTDVKNKEHFMVMYNHIVDRLRMDTSKVMRDGV